MVIVEMYRRGGIFEIAGSLGMIYAYIHEGVLSYSYHGIIRMLRGCSVVGLSDCGWKTYVICFDKSGPEVDKSCPPPWFK